MGKSKPKTYQVVVRIGRSIAGIGSSSDGDHKLQARLTKTLMVIGGRRYSLADGHELGVSGYHTVSRRVLLQHEDTAPEVKEAHRREEARKREARELKDRKRRARWDWEARVRSARNLLRVSEQSLLEVAIEFGGLAPDAPTWHEAIAELRERFITYTRAKAQLEADLAQEP